MTEKIDNPIEAINEYYRLKDKYKTEYYENHVKPILKSKKSKREKRLDFSKLPKPICINCKRNVGTIFSIVNNETEDFKQFIAKCGDIQEPCPLDIQINYGLRESIHKFIQFGLKEIETLKLNIIKEKNNSLFFKKNVTQIFNEITHKLTISTEDTGRFIETNILRNDNPEKRELLRIMLNEFGTEYLLPFKQKIADFAETDNDAKIDDAVNFYITEMLPKLTEIRNLKYDVNTVLLDEETNVYTLIQLPNSLENSEDFDKDKDKVVKFIRGTLNPKSKEKTKKLLIIEEDEEEENNLEESNAEENKAEESKSEESNAEENKSEESNAEESKSEESKSEESKSEDTNNVE